MTVLVIRLSNMSIADRATLCNCEKPAYSGDRRLSALPLRSHPLEIAMLMFKRSQLYVGLALAGLVQIIVRVALH
jgi:hypothetical protein